MSARCRTCPISGSLGSRTTIRFTMYKPCLANEGIGRGDELDLRFTYVRCSDMDAFESRGVTLLRATALNGSACGIRRLEEPE